MDAAPEYAATQGPARLIIQTPTGKQGNTQILPQIPDYNLSFIFRDKASENVSNQDASLIYLYTSQNYTKENVWASIEVAQTSSSLHRWEICEITWPTLHGYEPNVNQLDLRDLQIQENPPVLTRYFAFQYKENNETQVVLYWYQTSALMINDTLEQKQVKISLIAYPSSPQKIAETENDLLDFAVATANDWQPTATWGQIALAISKNGLTLPIISFACFVFVIIFAISEERRKKKAITETYKKLPDDDRQVVDVVRKTAKKSMATMQKNQDPSAYSIRPEEPTRTAGSS